MFGLHCCYTARHCTACTSALGRIILLARSPRSLHYLVPRGDLLSVSVVAELAEIMTGIELKLIYFNVAMPMSSSLSKTATAVSKTGGVGY